MKLKNSIIMELNKIKQKVEIGLEKIKNHPFILKANQLDLTQEQVYNWIMCAGRESRTFPEILKNMISWVENKKITDILNENLNDELGDGNYEHIHFVHYLHLIQKIGLKKEDFLSYEQKAGIDFAVSLAYNISNTKNIGLVIGYMLINEAITPLTYSAVKQAIKPYHPKLNTDFFDVHIEVDEIHVEQLYKAIEELKNTDLNDIEFGIDIGERGMSVLLDEALGVFDFIETIPKFSLEIPNF